jgi:hypothetical protein
MPVNSKTSCKDLFGDDPDENKITLQEYLSCFDGRIAEIQEFFKRKEEQNSNKQLAKS